MGRGGVVAVIRGACPFLYRGPAVKRARRFLSSQ